MPIDQTNVLLYLEIDMDNLFENVNVSKKDQETMAIAKEMMKRNVSEANLNKQLGIIQPILDQLFKEIGSPAELIIVQERINQVRNLFELLD